MVSVPRFGQFGIPPKLPRSNYTQLRFTAVEGYSDLPDLQATPGSLISSRNIWLWAGRLLPRPRLAQFGDINVLQETPTGAFVYNDVMGQDFPMAYSSDTVAYYHGGTWSGLSYLPSGSTNYPPSGGVNDYVFGVTTYVPRADVNIAAFTNGVDPIFAWGGPVLNPLTYSTLTGAPIAQDVAVLGNKLVAWNVREPSSTSQLVTRLQWAASGDPEEWVDTAQFAGYLDLLDMRGVGTRIFMQNDQLIIASDKELWHTADLGPPFIFDPKPFSRQLGIPFQRAAIQTTDGLFWLGPDFMVYRLPYWSVQIEEVGKAVQRTLQQTCADPTSAFFGYNGEARQLTLYYSAAEGVFPQRGLTLNTLTGKWTPQTFQHELVVGFQSPTAGGGIPSNVQWNQLVGSFASQTIRYNSFQGVTGTIREAVLGSDGTAYTFSYSAPHDDGRSVTHEATLGACFTNLPERRKFVDHVRWDLRANVSSTVSVAVSPDLGHSWPSEQSLTISAQSETTQVKTNWGVSGTYHTVRIRCDSPASFELNGVTIRAKLEGESF